MLFFKWWGLSLPHYQCFLCFFRWYKFLFVLQFRRVANLYFLTISILSTTPIRYVNARKYFISRIILQYTSLIVIHEERAYTLRAHNTVLFFHQLFCLGLLLSSIRLDDNIYRVIRHILILIVIICMDKMYYRCMLELDIYIRLSDS